MSISPITKDQWKSVVKNALIAGASTFVTLWAATNFSLSKATLIGCAGTAIAAAVKVVEKLFTEA